MLDLFGNERPAPGTGSRSKPAQLDLLDAAAERAAMASGLPKSQERARLVAPAGEEWAPPTCADCGGRLLLEAGGGRKFSCPRCA